MERKLGKAGVLYVGPSKRHSCENRPLFDTEGFCHGIMANVVLEPARVLPDGQEMPESYCWQLVCPGTLLPYSTQYWTSTKFSIWSKFGVLWNKLGLSKAGPEVDRAIGLPVVFKLERKDEKYRVEADSVILDTEQRVQHLRM